MLAAAMSAARLPAQTVDTVVVDNRNIFGPGAASLGIVARLADALHVTTRPWVIRRTLLLDPGDRYDSARAVESERALRRLLVFRDVALDTTRVDGRLALRVTTADGWSTKPEGSFASAAGSVSWSVGLVESNLLGTANALTAFYSRTPDRHQETVAWQSPGFILRRAQLLAVYANLSDGRLGWWSYGVPFYETSAPGALVTNGEAGTQRVLRFRDGVLSDSVQRRALRFAVSGGVALRATERDYVRLRYFAQWRRESFGVYGAGPAPDSLTGAAGAGLELGRSRFEVAHGLDQYARREDVDVSRRLWLGLWVAPRAFGYGAGRAGIGPEIQAQVGAPWRDGFGWVRLAASGLIGAGGLDSGRVEAGATAVSQHGPLQTLVLHAEGGMARRVAPGTEFDLWLFENGPRAYGAHVFTGTRRWWAVAEDRLLVADDFLGLLGVGLAPFVEWGGAWYAGERPRSAGDVGLALRLGATRSTRGEVTEISVARRLGAAAIGGAWAVTIRQAVDYR